MKAKPKCRNLDDAQLSKVREKREELFNLRFRTRRGSSRTPPGSARPSASLARGLTVANERGIDVERELKRQSQ